MLVGCRMPRAALGESAGELISWNWWLTDGESRFHPSRILFVPLISDLDGQCGEWSRARLIEMNDRFVAAMELAFAKGLESRAAAGATYTPQSLETIYRPSCCTGDPKQLGSRFQSPPPCP